MRVVSVNVGRPRLVAWQGNTVLTGIFKDPVDGRIPLRGVNLAGDAQADLSVHGGPDKAVYAYPLEHYDDWQAVLGRNLSPGAFGENLTTEGITEDSVHIGDEFRVGTARLVVTQPRMPCFKLGIRFGDPTMVKTFLRAGRPGIYFGVREEGEIGPGDTIDRVFEEAHRVTVSAMLQLILNRNADPIQLRRVLEVSALAAVWREEFKDRLGI
ncbi:MOSC domain-containing protein YiiM [Singulisphaera sp. GP187]|uniref:MOSC domain-containing protein n=1 Tax=Singulisphaera sp. GP187 TaxID=1882752 RepID=UPI000927EE7D|nr:MOSC domain-containing protein [Singulisphaera sp. GP187]SIO67905.1 MOSC domain-containing protein YiiM [Singulisphaera sp. GP187]